MRKISSPIIIVIVFRFKTMDALWTDVMSSAAFVRVSEDPEVVPTGGDVAWAAVLRPRKNDCLATQGTD
jgi:hypothetical protein